MSPSTVKACGSIGLVPAILPKLPAVKSVTRLQPRPRYIRTAEFHPSLAPLPYPAGAIRAGFFLSELGGVFDVRLSSPEQL